MKIIGVEIRVQSQNRRYEVKVFPLNLSIPDELTARFGAPSHMEVTFHTTLGDINGIISLPYSNFPGDISQQSIDQALEKLRKNIEAE